MIRIGGGYFSIVRICTGEVWLLSSSPGARYRVSCSSAAGWSRGVFSATKLYHSVSTSGPRARVKPRLRKIVQMSSTTWLTGWIVPRHFLRAGRVRSRSRSRRGSTTASFGQTPLERVAQRPFRAIGRRPRLRPLLGAELPQPPQQPRQAALPGDPGSGRGSAQDPPHPALRGSRQARPSAASGVRRSRSVRGCPPALWAGGPWRNPAWHLSC